MGRDKKLESWVKDSTFLGGGKGEPTIVTPKQCKSCKTGRTRRSPADKTRFRTAMEKFYFPSVPDRWTKNAVEETLHEDESGGTITGTI